MKVTHILRTCGALLTLVIMAMSCVKETGKEIAKEENNFSNKALVQVFNATVSSTRTYVYVDGAPVTGAALTYGNVFPSSAYSFNVAGGLRAFLIKDTLSTSTQKPITFAENFDAGKNYTIFMYDTTPSAKQLTIQSDIIIPSDTTARVRFANFIHNSAAVPAVDVFSKLRNENIFTNVLKTEATGYISYASAVGDTLIIRETGTMNQMAVLNGFNPTRKRSYTLIYRGSHRGTRVLSAFANN